MKFELIDMKNWKRAEYFHHYLHEVPCTYSMTVNLDISTLLAITRQNSIKLYPAIIYVLTKTVNSHQEFRTAMNNQNEVGIFDVMHPSYTIFNQENETFSSIWTTFNEKFGYFYKDYLDDVQQYSQAKNLFPKQDSPINTFNVSSLPWVSFSGFNLNLPKANTYLLPIFTVGKYCESNGKILLPLSIQAHHAVCDGFHLSKFIHDLQTIVNEFCIE